jgi:hypothetical protein
MTEEEDNRAEEDYFSQRTYQPSFQHHDKQVMSHLAH